MRQYQKTLALLTFALAAVFSLQVQAQSADNGRFLSLAPPTGLPIIPVMEGWIANPDGTTSFSFGFINRNDVPVDIPLGTANYIEPAKYSGMQPTHFPAGRSTGVFTVTVPAAEANDDIWWYIKTGDEEPLKVPGRRGASAYELDFILPRPQGAMQPHAGFGENGARLPGLFAQVGEFEGNVKAGEPVVLTVNVEDVQVEGGRGIANVIATFSEPGEYMIHTKVENFRAPDSSDGDQCCWTNIVQKVTVTQ